MINIFAKYGTDEKAMVVCSQEQVRNIRVLLSKKYGGNWLLVDELQANSEILKFNDGLKYLGFTGKEERFCNGIEVLSAE
ncbi:MAG: hypothetical protein ACK5JD_10840 [Mangrovibacterium sp.]